MTAGEPSVPEPELRELERAILADDRALAGTTITRIIPAQLPADVAGFIGRDALLRPLDGLLPAGFSTAGLSEAILHVNALGLSNVMLAFQDKSFVSSPGGQNCRDTFAWLTRSTAVTFVAWPVARSNR